MQHSVFKIKSSFSLENFTIYLKIREIHKILLSSSYDGIVAYLPVHPLDFSRASIGYSKAVVPLIVTQPPVSKTVFVVIVSFRLTELSSGVWLFTLICVKC